MAARRNDSQRADRATAYIQGNTVRRAQALPQEIPRREPAVAPPLAPQKSREERARERERKYHARRNVAQARAITQGYVAFLICAMSFCCGVCSFYLYLQSDITTRLATVTALETTISDLKEDNDALAIRIETLISLEEIKERAASLGLVYPTEEQIFYYSVENNDYMNQYANIASN